MESPHRGGSSRYRYRVILPALGRPRKTRSDPEILLFSFFCDLHLQLAPEAPLLVHLLRHSESTGASVKLYWCQAMLVPSCAGVELCWCQVVLYSSCAGVRLCCIQAVPGSGRAGAKLCCKLCQCQVVLVSTFSRVKLCWCQTLLVPSCAAIRLCCIQAVLVSSCPAGCQVELVLQGVSLSWCQAVLVCWQVVLV